jgi:putative tricarboxylic transport membrane protein
MSGIGDRAAALVTGCGGLVFSVVYILAARRIEDSLLADPVGASGVPVAIGGLMALVSTVLILKGLLPGSRSATRDSAQQADTGARPAASLRAHALAGGLLLILAAYLIALPWLGYVVAVGLLAAAIAWFAGGRQTSVLIGFAVVTGPVLWLVFDFALRVRMPAGIWPTLFAG